MMFESNDVSTLVETLDAIAVPMFVVERENPADLFRIICVNAAHTAQSGLSNEQVSVQTVAEILSRVEAEAVQDRYAQCIAMNWPTTHQERMELAGKNQYWSTTLQPIAMADGRERIIGIAIPISVDPMQDRLFDAAFYAIKAQIQAGKIMHFLDLAQARNDVPADMRNMAMVVGNLTRSMESLLADIRALAPTGQLEPAYAKAANDNARRTSA